MVGSSGTVLFIVVHTCLRVWSLITNFSTSRAIRTDDLKAKALKLHVELGIQQSFTASNGWLDRFKRRMDVCCCGYTVASQHIPLPALAQIFWDSIKATSKTLKVLIHVDFFCDLHCLVLKVAENHIEQDSIINMDETPCWFDMAGGTIFCSRGKKDMLQKTSGHEKMR